MDPRDRLKRRYPGEGLAELRPGMARLGDRDKPLREVRVARETTVRTRKGTERRMQNLGKPWPNAPLLKRLVRYPYRQHTTDGRRQTIHEPVPWDAARLEERDPVSSALRGLREALRGGSPLRQEPTPRPAMPPVPTLDAWLSGRDA